MDDLTLLRKFEPVVRFTHGELFFPCAVDEYIRQCSLWLRDSKGNSRQLVAEGELSVEKLARFSTVPAGHTLYLRFVDKPLEALEYQRWRLRPDRPSFHAPGRLARVGLFSRLLDSFFNLSLLIRGTVPGGTTAAAEIKYRQMKAKDPRFVYYGRVLREGGYIILHYLFFYAMNDWRSSFYGVNDHEADWEQIFVYLSDEGEAEPVPRWVAYASHDFSGDDLRRRWDDPELQKVNQHPVVFAGAGSHASYFLPGEYLMSVEPEFLRPLKNGLVALRKFWEEKLGQGRARQTAEEAVHSLLSVPFVDYARGDGLSLGPEQAHQWSPILLTEQVEWVQYRGLWGLDTRDPLGGERAPAGPRYNRNGSIRTSWYNPLGWAGLDKVPPPNLVPAELKKYIDILDRQQKTVSRQIDQTREAVRQLGLEVEALQETNFALYQTRQEKLVALQDKLHNLHTHAVALAEARQASLSYLKKIEVGEWGDPQAHIQHRHLPEPPADQQARIVELWAAVSSGLLFLALTLLLVFAPSHWLTWAILIGAIFFLIEAAVRGRLTNLLLNLTVLLAVITGLILIKDFWSLLLIGGLFALVLIMIVENLRELRRT